MLRFYESETKEINNKQRLLISSSTACGKVRHFFVIYWFKNQISESLFFYASNLIPSFINTKYTIFMHSCGTCSTNYLICLALFTSPSTIRGSQFLFVNINFFFLMNVCVCVCVCVCVFICFYWLFWFQSSLFFCIDVVWFLSVLVLFLVLLVYFLYFAIYPIFSFSRWTSNNFRFLPMPVHRLNFAAFESSPFHQSSQWIASKKVSWKPQIWDK